MDFLRFLISKIFLKNLALAVAIALVIFLGTLLWLKIYTHHGQAISVPNLTGLTIEEVDDVVSSRKLRFEVIDSIFSNDMPRGTVLKQNPAPNSKVKVNRRLFITMNAINPEKVSMPNLVALSDRQAILALTNAGLDLGEISFKPDYAKNSVLEQTFNGSAIAPGTKIEKGSSIDLVLGMGLSNQTVLVPDLIGLDLSMAKATVSSRYLNFGLATYDETVLNEEDSIMAFVYRQNPEYDGARKLNVGMEVFVWLSVDSTLLPQIDTLAIDLKTEAENEQSF